MSEKIRVLVVDDSALMRKLIPQVLQRDPSIEVVGTAMDGEVGLRKLDELKPHVVTLDLDMPRMDGLEMLRQITRKHRVPVILVSAQTERGASVTLKALALGAFDFVTKPPEAASGRLDQIAAELALKIKVAAGSGAPKMIITVPPLKQKEQRRTSMPNWPSKIVAIGISTGGPNALQYLFSQLPPDFPGCILVVQHMPEGFTEMFARRLDECSAIEVKEAQSGDLLLAGRALVCPGQPAHEGAADGARQRGDSGGPAESEWAQTVGERAVPFRGAGIRQQRDRRADDRHGRRWRGRPGRDSGRGRIDDRAKPGHMHRGQHAAFGDRARICGARGIAFQSFEFLAGEMHSGAAAERTSESGFGRRHSHY